MTNFNHFFERSAPIIVVLAGLILSACTLPRGAPITSEILRGAELPDADFVAYEITRETLKEISKWPANTQVQAAKWLDEEATTMRLGPGDALELIIWDTSNSSLFVSPGQKFIPLPALRLDERGRVFIPYVGSLDLAGKTLTEARALVHDGVAGVSRSAQIQLSLSQGMSNEVSVAGGVAQPDTYPVDADGLSVIEVLASAGGVRSDFTNAKISVQRDGRLYGVSYDALLKNPKLDAQLHSGDAIYVEENVKSFQVLGASGREEIVEFDGPEVSARRAIALAGGLNDTRANPQSVLVLRQYDDINDAAGPKKSRVIFVINLTTADGLFSAENFQIADNDLVLMTESPVTTAETLIRIARSGFALAN